MKKLIIRIDPSWPIVNENGVVTDQFRIFIRQIEDRALFIGTGTPEGSLEAQQGAEYLDETGGAGAVKYIKQLADIGGDRTLGWVAI